MLQISASGTPYEIGFKHGSEAREQVAGSVAFYEKMFAKASSLAWPAVQALAGGYEASIGDKWPHLLEEMKGVAAGAGRPLVDVLALNVRTEIAFGQFSDGCTALSWLTPDASFLAQNWDWEVEQKANIVALTIAQAGKPTIKMLTEAGIVGKIGLNSAGVGVCFNAIRAHGMDASRLPVHLALRVALEASSREAALAALEEHGVASSCHMLVADGATGAVGVEWSAVDAPRLPMDAAGRVLHTNHYLLEHKPGVADTWPALIDDSRFRLARLGELLDGLGKTPSIDDVRGLFADESNYPAAICRGPEDKVAATLFNIVMDLKKPAAKIILGLPTRPDAFLEFTF